MGDQVGRSYRATCLMSNGIRSTLYPPCPPYASPSPSPSPFSILHSPFSILPQDCFDMTIEKSIVSVYITEVIGLEAR